MHDFISHGCYVKKSYYIFRYVRSSKNQEITLFSLKTNCTGDALSFKT
jgi:hypothetical protein